jgi:hypothetical protein
VKRSVNKHHPKRMLDTRHEKSDGRPSPFGGFLPLTANFLYCPNQMFDVCLPHASRGVVRLVAYLLRRTLGWLDQNGNPIEQRITVSYRDFIHSANVSRGAITKVIADAIAAGFVRRVRRGRANADGQAGEAARFELRWDEGGRYVTDPKRFRGFFTGEGHRSPVPNSFFDRVVPTEPLAVAQVVGAVLRHTVGYQNQFGGRRPHASLSYSYLQRYTGIGGRRHLRDAVQQALASNYIRVVQKGFFDPLAGHKGQAAQYAAKWAEADPTLSGDSSKREPGPASPEGARMVQKGNQRHGTKREPAARFRKGTSHGPKWEPAERFRKGTKEKTYTKETLQRQQQSAAADPSVIMLMEAGFDQRSATTLAAEAGFETIRQQVGCLSDRRPSRNRLGMLRQAILEKWPEPRGGLRTSVVLQTPTARFASCFYAGLGDNPGEPVATPSDSDLIDAEHFVTRLVTFSNDPAQLEKWGRALGTMVRQRAESGRPAVTSLRSALRAHGDRFFAELTAESTRRRAAEADERTESRRAAVQAEYEKYLEGAEVTIRRERPEDYARFEGWREQERQRYAESKVGGKQLLLIWFDSSSKRLEDVRSFFGTEVLGFEAWATSSFRSGNPECESSPSSMPKEVAVRAPSP